MFLIKFCKTIKVVKSKWISDFLPKITNINLINIFLYNLFNLFYFLFKQGDTMNTQNLGIKLFSQPLTLLVNHDRSKIA